MSNQNEKVAALIKFFGNQEKLAKSIGVKQGSVTGWLNNKHGISRYNAEKIEVLTGGKFLAVDLCDKLAEHKQQLEKLKTPSGN